MKLIVKPDFVDATYVNNNIVQINCTEESMNENPFCLTVEITYPQAKDIWFELNKTFGKR